MTSCRLTGAAEIDLTQIFWQGLERFGPVVTERYLVELENAFDLLSRYPDAARLRTDLIPAVRVYPHAAHVIVYRAEDAGIVILRVRSARENWMASPLGDND